MSVTIDCGEGKHKVCSGSGTEAYMFPQLRGNHFYCGCNCHHEGIQISDAIIKGVPCKECLENLRSSWNDKNVVW